MEANSATSKRLEGKTNGAVYRTAHEFEYF
jgi:hypothetical protein